MGIDINEKTLIFIEETSLQTKSIVQELDNILNHQGYKNITFGLDSGIHESLENYKKQHSLSEGYIFEGLIDIIVGTKKVEYIETNNYFDFSKVEEAIKKGKFKKALFITQKESVYFVIEPIKTKYDFVKIYRCEDLSLKEWVVVNKVNKAFFIEKNAYNNPIELKSVEYVFSPIFGYLRLQKDAVYEGGEGFIYKTYTNQLVKIYHKEHQTYINHKKLQYMLTIDIFNPFINWPKDIIYYENTFIGYVMDEIADTEQLEDIRADGFKGYGILDRYEICYNFINHMHYLHQKNIVIGDLKLDNILIKYPNEVYMIDCGSYQVDDYPCVVYHPEYTKKMYTEKELKEFLRSPEDEYFAINTIIFELLVGKKPNFDRTSGEINANRKIFLYPLDVSKIDKNSPIDLQLWKLMSSKMREMFFFYFTQDKVSYLPEWIDEIKIILDANKK